MKIEVGMKFKVNGVDVRTMETRYRSLEQVVEVNEDGCYFILKCRSLVDSNDTEWVENDSDDIKTMKCVVSQPDMSVENGDRILAFPIMEGSEIEHAYIDFRWEISDDETSGRCVPVHIGSFMEYLSDDNLMNTVEEWEVV
jgi:hypothetical protein